MVGITFMVFITFMGDTAFVVVLFVVRHLDFLGEFKIKGEKLIPFYSAPSCLKR